ncbi:hypothetical protein ZWY2020_027536 [Hordeum vulgare]|nr:hypothetical protein ZWY2020_027536 [Hordeum vulgare]
MAQRWLLVTRFYLTFAFRGHRSQPSNPDSYLVPAPPSAVFALHPLLVPLHPIVRTVLHPWPHQLCPCQPRCGHGHGHGHGQILHRNHQLLQPKRQLPPGFLAARPLRQPRRPPPPCRKPRRRRPRRPMRITEKYGLEVGLWKIFSSKEEEEEARKTKKSRTDQAKELLGKYGGAYLATSITLSLISFTACYLSSTPASTSSSCSARSELLNHSPKFRLELVTNLPWTGVCFLCNLELHKTSPSPYGDETSKKQSHGTVKFMGKLKETTHGRPDDDPLLDIAASAAPGCCCRGGGGRRQGELMVFVGDGEGRTLRVQRNALLHRLHDLLRGLRPAASDMVSDRRAAAPPNPAITGPARREPGPGRISGDRPDAGSLGRVPARSAAGSGTGRCEG